MTRWLLVLVLVGCGDNAKRPEEHQEPSCLELGCDDNDPCTNDICDLADGCQHVSFERCAEPHCAITECASVDTDGDGLQDAWESQGYVDVNCNGVNDGEGNDVQLHGADPAVADIYIEIDWLEMAGSGAACTDDASCNLAVSGESCVDGRCKHTHKPRQASLDLVRLAAARGLPPLEGDPEPPADLAGKRGFRIHWEHGTAIAETPGVIISFGTDEGTRVLNPACVGPNAQNFFDLKDASFYSGDSAAFLDARKRIVHYAIAMHDSQCPPGPLGGLEFCQQCPQDRGGGFPQPLASGTAERPGNDFMISMGDRFFSLGRPLPVIPREEGGTILHELGHNLGLGHGVELVNGVKSPTLAYEYSPIYFSVMNYNYQFGLLYAATPGSANPTTTRLDFADETVCADLQESSLVESAGAQCGATSTRVIRYIPNTGLPRFGSATTGTGVDWNGNGTLSSTPSAVDLNGFVPNETFYTINEWATSNGKLTSLVFDSFCSDWTVADGLAGQEARIVEPSPR